MIIRAIGYSSVIHANVHMPIILLYISAEDKGESTYIN